MAGDGTQRTRHVNGLRVGTRCETIDEFVQKFHRFCEDGAVFVPHAKRQVGVDCAFSFDLANGTSALCGLGTVLDHFTTPNNRFRRPGVVIGITRLQADTPRVFEDLLIARAFARDAGHPDAEIESAGAERAHLGNADDAGRATPVPVRMARAVTSAIEVVDTAAVKAPRLTAPLPAIAVPTILPPPRTGIATASPRSATTSTRGDTSGPEQSNKTPPPAAVVMTPTKTPAKVTLASSSSAMAPARLSPPAGTPSIGTPASITAPFDNPPIDSRAADPPAAAAPARDRDSTPVGERASHVRVEPAVAVPLVEALPSPHAAGAAFLQAPPPRRYRWLAAAVGGVATVALALALWPRSRDTASRDTPGLVITDATSLAVLPDDDTPAAEDTAPAADTPAIAIADAPPVDDTPAIADAPAVEDKPIVVAPPIAKKRVTAKRIVSKKAAKAAAKKPIAKKPVKKKKKATKPRKTPCSSLACL